MEVPLRPIPLTLIDLIDDTRVRGAVTDLMVQSLSQYLHIPHIPHVSQITIPLPVPVKVLYGPICYPVQISYPIPTGYRVGRAIRVIWVSMIPIRSVTEYRGASGFPRYHGVFLAQDTFSNPSVH